MAAAALRLESSSRAALAARSRPSRSKPVMDWLDPPLGGLAGERAEERDSSFFFLPAPPNMVDIY